MKAGVLGYPVSQSLSPMIFKFLSEYFDMPLEYDFYEVPSVELKSFVEQSKNFVGFNVTIPYKETILSFLDKNVQNIGACNVVKIVDKKWVGYNTDVFGIEKTLEEYNFNLKNKDVVIFGAGGGARAAIIACKDARNITVVARNKARVEKLKQTFKINVAEVGPKADWYFNATPVDIEMGDGLVFDMRYRQEDSLGLDMLVWQALKTWEIWFPQSKPYHLKQHILKMLEKAL